MMMMMMHLCSLLYAGIKVTRQYDPHLLWMNLCLSWHGVIRITAMEMLSMFQRICSLFSEGDFHTDK